MSPVLGSHLCVAKRYVVHVPEFVQQHVSCEESFFSVGISFVGKEQLIYWDLSGIAVESGNQMCVKMIRFTASSTSVTRYV